MHKASVVALLLVPALVAGCNKADVNPTTAPAPSAIRADTAGPAAANPSPATVKAVRPPPPTVPLLAYAHLANMELPGQAIRPLMERHQAMCEEAGPAQCQVLSAKVDDDQGEVAGSLSLQAQPGWLAGFRGRLDDDAAQAGGRIKQSGTATEDLSRSIVDTDAAIRAKITLRDRLQRLLASRPGKLQDLVALEQQLAEVQGQIDTARSELSVMRTRVQTSKLTIAYSSIPAPVSSRAVEPLKHSVNGAFAIVMRGLAVLVSTAAVLAPFFIVGVPVWLFVRWRLRGTATPVRPQSSAGA